MLSDTTRAGIPRGLWLWWAVLVSIALITAIFGTFSSAGQAPAVTGQLGLITIDAQDSTRLEWTLYLPDDVRRRVEISDEVLAAAGGLRAITGQWVSITPDALPTRDGAMVAQSIEVSAIPRGFTQFSVDPGPTAHWLNLPCKFSDNPNALDTTAIEAIFDATVDHVPESYTALSHGAHTFTSETYAWATLPNTKTFYTNQNDIVELYKDCRTAHGLGADARNVNLIFSDDYTNGSAFGGQIFEQNHLVRFTSLPPWGWSSVSLIIHETGHAYGIPHSNNSDGDAFTYENPWDVMSSVAYAKSLGVYGGAASPHNTYHVYKVGWLDSNDTVTIPTGSTQTVTIDHWGVNNSANVYAALIPLDYTDPNRATQLYVVEARRGAGNAGNHQENLPDADGVLIYRVDTTRREPAWLVGHITNPTDDTLAVFTVGETSTDPAQLLTINVTGATTDGYTVEIQRGIPPAVTPEPTSGVSGTADIQVTILEPFTSPVYDDGRVEVTFEAKNVGTTTTSGVQLSVDFSESMFETPDDHGFLWGYSGTAPIVSYGRLDNGIYIRADTLAPNSYIRARVEIYPDSTDNGVWTMRAVAAHAKTEATPANNTAQRSVLVLPTPDAEVTGAALLTNPAFDANTNRDLSGWTLKRAAGTPNNDKLACDDQLNNKFFSRSAPCAFRFTGNTNENSILSQTVVLNAPAISIDSALVLSAWVRAANIPSGAAKLKATISFAGTIKKQNLTLNLPTSTGGAYRRALSKPALLKYPNPTQVVVSVIYKAPTTSAKLWIDDLSVVITP